MLMYPGSVCAQRHGAPAPSIIDRYTLDTRDHATLRIKPDSVRSPTGSRAGFCGVTK